MLCHLLTAHNLAEVRIHLFLEDDLLLAVVHNDLSDDFWLTVLHNTFTASDITNELLRLPTLTLLESFILGRIVKFSQEHHLVGLIVALILHRQSCNAFQGLAIDSTNRVASLHRITTLTLTFAEMTLLVEF